MTTALIKHVTKHYQHLNLDWQAILQYGFNEQLQPIDLYQYLQIKSTQKQVCDNLPGLFVAPNPLVLVLPNKPDVAVLLPNKPPLVLPG